MIGSLIIAIAKLNDSLPENQRVRVDVSASGRVKVKMIYNGQLIGVYRFETATKAANELTTITDGHISPSLDLLKWVRSNGVVRGHFLENL